MEPTHERSGHLDLVRFGVRAAAPRRPRRRPIGPRSSASNGPGVIDRYAKSDIIIIIIILLGYACRVSMPRITRSARLLAAQ